MIDIPKSEARAFEEESPSWKPTRLPNGSAGAIFKCPNGHIGTLVDHEPDSHSIDAEGVVSPSVVCPEDGCGFHDHVRLVGWSSVSNQDREPS